MSTPEDIIRERLERGVDQEIDEIEITLHTERMIREDWEPAFVALDKLVNERDKYKNAEQAWRSTAVDQQERALKLREALMPFAFDPDGSVTHYPTREQILHARAVLKEIS